MSYGHCLSLFDIRTSLSMVICRSIHVAENGMTSFFYWLNSIPLTELTDLFELLSYMYICPGVELLHMVALFFSFFE